MLLAGPTGCGKTETFRVFQRVEEQPGIPVIMRNAPDYAPNDNWKGEKFLDMLPADLCTEAIDLYTRLHGKPQNMGDFEKVRHMASNGIILLDEFDKMHIGGASTDNFCRDYQATLLKMIEGGEYTGCKLNHPQESFHDDDGDEKKSELKVNTGSVMFIFLGAFDGMQKITRRRLLQEQLKRKNKECQVKQPETGRIGFTAVLKPLKDAQHSSLTEELPDGTDLTPNLEDMIEYGIIRELAGRIAIRVNYKALSVANIIKIMKESKTSVYLEYQERFENMGHKLVLDDAAFREIALMAEEKKTGARGLSNIFYDMLSPTLYKLSGTDEPTECILRGSDIRQNRPPVLRRIDVARRNRMDGKIGA